MQFRSSLHVILCLSITEKGTIFLYVKYNVPLRHSFPPLLLFAEFNYSAPRDLQVAVLKKKMIKSLFGPVGETLPWYLSLVLKI